MVSRMMKLAPSPIRRFILHTGRRGLFLLFFAFLWTTTGLRWKETPPRSDSYKALYSMLPPRSWGYIFVAMAGVMALGAFVKKLEDLSYGISAWLALFLAITISISASSLHGPIATQAWTTVATYLVYAFFIWVVSGWPETPVIQVIKDPAPKDDSGRPIDSSN